MAEEITSSMIPGATIHTNTFTEGFHVVDGDFKFLTVTIDWSYVYLSWPELDGDQNLYFCWIDPIKAATRMIAHSKFRGKLYTQYEPQYLQNPKRLCFSRANSGLVFQAAQAVDPDSSPLMIIVYADKSFSGQHRTHHPIYSK